MSKQILRVYADTSVFGGVFDREFERASRLFFRLVESRQVTLVTSALVDEELTPAPAEVRRWFERFRRRAEVVNLTEEAIQLRRAYLKADILTRKFAADALHVALATVEDCPVLVSWNCRHIVHYRRIQQYNAINRLHGHREVAIHTPLEVIGDEEQDV